MPEPKLQHQQRHALLNHRKASRIMAVAVKREKQVTDVQRQMKVSQRHSTAFLNSLCAQ